MFIVVSGENCCLVVHKHSLRWKKMGNLNNIFPLIFSRSNYAAFISQTVKKCLWKNGRQGVQVICMRWEFLNYFFPGLVRRKLKVSTKHFFSLWYFLRNLQIFLKEIYSLSIFSHISEFILCVESTWKYLGLCFLRNAQKNSLDVFS